MDEHIPKDKCGVKTKIKPAWMNKGIFWKIKKNDNVYKRYLYSQEGLHYLFYLRMRNECTREVRKAKYEHHKNVALNCKPDSKCFWKYVKSKLNMAIVCRGANQYGLTVFNSGEVN